MKKSEEDGWKIAKIKPVEVAFGNLKLQQNPPKRVGREGFTLVILRSLL